MRLNRGLRLADDYRRYRLRNTGFSSPDDWLILGQATDVTQEENARPENRVRRTGGIGNTHHYRLKTLSGRNDLQSPGDSLHLERRRWHDVGAENLARAVVRTNTHSDLYQSRPRTYLCRLTDAFPLASVCAAALLRVAAPCVI